MSTILGIIFGPSEALATSGANLGRPLLLVIIPLFLLLAAVTKSLEGDVIGFRNFAWAPLKKKKKDSNQSKILGTPCTIAFLGRKGGNFKSCPWVPKLDMRP